MPVIHSIHDLIDDAVQNGGTLILRNETYQITKPLVIGKLNLRGMSDLGVGATSGTVEDEVLDDDTGIKSLE